MSTGSFNQRVLSVRRSRTLRKKRRNPVSSIKGQLTIGRVRSSTDPDGWVEIWFRDADACCEFATFKISPKDFADAIMGLGYAPGTIEIRGLDVVGMKSENKVEAIPAEHPYGDKKKLALLQAAVKEFEVDGWRARDSDLENHYSYKRGCVHVAFFRHVPKE
jgi:hypothetical protein